MLYRGINCPKTDIYKGTIAQGSKQEQLNLQSPAPPGEELPNSMMDMWSNNAILL